MINFAIIGTGSAAKYHIKELLRNSNTTPVIIYSEDIKRARDLAEKFNIPYTDKIKDIVSESIHAFDISTYNSNHFKYAEIGLLNNKHIILEKPACINIDELNKLINLQKEKKLIALVNFQRRYHQNFLEFKENFHNNKYGKLISGHTEVIVPRKEGYYDERKGTIKFAGGGSLIYAGIHELDQLCQLFFFDMVTGFKNNLTHNREVEDTAALVLVDSPKKYFHTFFVTTSDIACKEVIRHLFNFSNYEVILDQFHIFEKRKVEDSPKSLIKRVKEAISPKQAKIEKMKRGTYADILNEFVEAYNSGNTETLSNIENSVYTHKIIFNFYQGKKKVNLLGKKEKCLTRQDAIKNKVTELAYYPGAIWIEPTNVCNFKCINCPQAYDFKAEKGFMDFSLYKKIIDETSSFKKELKISLHYLGESLLHPKIVDFVDYASSRDLKIGFNSNVSIMTEELFRVLIKAGLKKIVISLNDTTKEQYEKNQVGGNFEQTCKNIKMMIRVKHEMKSDILLRMNTLGNSNRENENKKQKLRQMFGNSIDYKTYLYHGWGGSVSNEVKDIKNIEVCNFIFGALVVMWKGKILPCTRDGKCELIIGDLNNQGLLDVWNSNVVQKYRRLHLDGQWEKLPKPCQKCSHIVSSYGNSDTRLND